MEPLAVCSPCSVLNWSNRGERHNDYEIGTTTEKSRSHGCRILLVFCKTYRSGGRPIFWVTCCVARTICSLPAIPRPSLMFVLRLYAGSCIWRTAITEHGFSTSDQVTIAFAISWPTFSAASTRCPSARWAYKAVVSWRR